MPFYTSLVLLMGMILVAAPICFSITLLFYNGKTTLKGRYLLAKTTTSKSRASGQRDI